MVGSAMKLFLLGILLAKQLGLDSIDPIAGPTM
jgi:hypothetical protein